MNSTTSNNRPNNKLPLPASIGDSDSSHFDVYQQASVGSGNVTTRTLVPAPISADPYRKTLIAKLFFCQIISLINTPSVSFSDLMTTVASYFPLNTGSAEREAEAAVICIRSAFFRVSNLQRVGFADVSGKPIQVPDPDQRPADLTYLILRSVDSAVATDKRAPNKSLLLEIFEYVGHDIIAGGTLTAQSKYGLVNVWSNPTTGDGMYSYNMFCPMFQLKFIPLRQLYIHYTRKKNVHSRNA